MSTPDDSPKYPWWVLRFNRVITSRRFTYLAALLFVMEAIPRLLDGRVLRGMANLVVAAGLIALQARTRAAALGQDPATERRAAWLARRPVLGGLAAGAVWARP